MGYAIGLQMQALGVNVSYSPVADININPLNPVIGDRSFGEDKEAVALRSIAYMKGLQNAGIIACGKHFPGHGDTDMDSHLDLPELPFDKQRLKNIELYPFQELIDAGIGGMMVAHLHVPAIDSAKNISTTPSKNAVTGLLKNEMGFDGLIFTDALEMKGVTKNFKADEVAIKCFEAGNDLLVLPESMDLAYSGLKKAFQNGKLSTGQLDSTVRKILYAKFQLGLDSLVLPDPIIADEKAFDPYAIGVKHKLIEDAITVVHNQKAFIPLVNIVKPKIATLSIGSTSPTTFQNRLDSYFEGKQYHVSHSLSGVDIQSLLKNLQSYDKVIISFHNMSNKPGGAFGLTKEALTFVQNINRMTDIIVVIFGSPYSLKYFENIDHVIMAYEDQPEIEDITAQGLVGVFGFKGKLPVGVSNIYPLHHGFTTPSLKRLGYSVPERVGMVSDSLQAIQRIVNQMIKWKAAPGCQVLIAKDGRIIYEEAFGKHTYKERDSVYLNDLYDVASLTKVVATTPTVMRLQKEGRIDIHRTLGSYLPWLSGSNKEKFVIEKVMAHHAGLQSWIPFFERTVTAYDDGSFEMEPDVYCEIPSMQYCIPVAADMYLDQTYIDSIHRQIYKSPLNADGTYVYSDLGFIMLTEIIKNETGVSLDKYVDSVFYKPLGMNRTGYLPLRRFTPDEIVPSEIDTYFRCQTLDGYVHDMGCAMMGGVCGHAGIFSDAEDLAKLFTMYMNGGSYGGKEFIDPAILKHFTTRHPLSTRRGIGFDMKELDTRKKILTSKLASSATYGHTGFTGTCAWNDPESGLTYIFLSNRTYPTMRNGQLMNLAIRERIHSRAYKAIMGYKPYVHQFVQG